MKKLLFFSAILVLNSFFYQEILWAQGSSGNSDITEFTLKLKPDASIATSSIVDLNNSFKVKKVHKIFRMTEEKYNRLFKDQTYIDAAGNVKKVPDLSRWYCITLESPLKFENVEKEYKKDSNIEEIHQPGMDYSLPAETIPNEYTSRSLLAAEQWSLDKINTPDAWDYTTGSSEIIIAPIDNGVDWDHIDILPNIWTNSDEIPGNGVDDDLNGFVDDVNGWDFVDNDNDPYWAWVPVLHHGTYIAGLAGAATNNNEGIASAGWNCKQMILRTINYTAGFDYKKTAKSIEYATDNGADIITISFGQYDPFVTTEFVVALDYAYSQGVLILGGAGNDNSNNQYYPAAYTNVTAVGGTDQNDQRYIQGANAGSNYGDWVEIAAPMVNLKTTAITDDGGPPYISNAQGTSYSTPIVGGVSCLIKSKNPDLINNDIRFILFNNAFDVGAGQGLGNGRVDAYNALNRMAIVSKPNWSTYFFNEDLITLNWANPSFPNFSGVVIWRSTVPIKRSPAFGISPTQTPPLGITKIYHGSNINYTDNNVNAGVTYYYKIYAYDNEYYYSNGNIQTATAGITSNTPLATAYNNGRRLVKIGTYHHLVYENNGDIYYTSSADGTNWSAELSITGGCGLCKNPSISRGIGSIINVIWEHHEAGTVRILFKRRVGSSWQETYTVGRFTQTHDARPVIAAHSDGSFLVAVCEGPDGLYYGSSLGNYYYWAIHSKVPTTNQYSVFPYGGFPSVQATTYPCGLAWKESSKIYYMKFTYSGSVITWDTGSRTQIGSGSYPSVEGDYDNSPGPDYYTIAYQGSGDYNYIPLHVYRSRTGTYSTFESWLKFHQRPSLFSDQSTNTEYSLVWYEGFGNDVLQSNYTNNQWSSPSALSSNGRHPTINSGNGYGGALSGPSTAVWTYGGSSPYLVQTTSTGLSKVASPALTCLRRVEIDLSFLNSDISEGSIVGNVTLDLFQYKTGDKNKSFEPVREKSDRKKFLDSQPFSLPADTLEVQYMLKVRDFKVNGKIDKNVLKKEIFHFNLNDLHSQLASINTITLQDLIDFNLTDFYIKNTIELDLSRLKGKTGYIEGEWPKQVTPTLTEVYIIGEADSLYRGISKEKAIEFIETQDQIDVVPENFVLFQNYPNPFNPVTHIVFDLPEDSNVKLTVYTINGELVQNLVNGHRPAGRYEIDFDGSHLSSGIYIYRIQAGKFSQAKRMLLIK
jgi:hypothetical protein